MSRSASSALRLLAAEEAWARRALPRANRAWWTASLSGRPADYRRMEAADRAINRHYSRPAALRHIQTTTGQEMLDALTRRRLQRLDSLPVFLVLE